ncbi:MAG TPA: histidine kinase, partial [Paenibacillus sp.]|nr:histidine kinase [Paenibacillus sp.]
MRIRRRRKAYTFKSRVTIAFVISSLITFSLVCAASYYTIYTIVHDKVDRSIELAMNQLAKDLDMTLDNLTRVSYQLSYSGVMAGDLDEFLTNGSLAAKRRHFDQINEYLLLIDNTNPNVGLHFYTDAETGERFFANQRGNIDFDAEALPSLAQHAIYDFYGPHPSIGPGEELVFSLVRPVDLEGDVRLQLYIETNADTLRNVLEPNRLGMKAAYMLANPSGKVAYSEIDDFRPGDAYSPSSSGSYYEKTGQYGWKLLASVDDSVFHREVNAWAKRMAFLGALFMLASIAAGALVWRAVYGPIRIFRQEIGMLAGSNFHSPGQPTGVAEFDKTMGQFMKMKEHIRYLLEEVKQKERDKRHLEVDKLLAQINPHFLYNTLNTVQWLARSEGQHTIVKLIANLTQLLRYNLGKEGSLATIDQEIDALRNYIALQLIRNDYQFQVQFDVEERAGSVSIPRFILQPLVENAIYHGLRDGQGTIGVVVRREADDTVAIEVRDDGAGLAPGVAELSGEEAAESMERKYGLGIGLKYVSKMLEV